MKKNILLFLLFSTVLLGFVTNVSAGGHSGPGFVFEDIGDTNTSTLEIISTGAVKIINATNTSGSNYSIPFYLGTTSDKYLELYINVDDIENNVVRDIHDLGQLYGKIIDSNSGYYDNKFYKLTYFETVNQIDNYSSDYSLFFTEIDEAYYGYTNLGEFEESLLENFIDKTSSYDIYTYCGLVQVYYEGNNAGLHHLFVEQHNNTVSFLIFEQNPYYGLSGSFYTVQTTYTSSSNFDLIIMYIDNEISIDPVTGDPYLSINTNYRSSWSSAELSRLVLVY